MTAAVSFDLPFPDKLLWPNGRTKQWGAKHRVVKAARFQAWGAALAAGVTKADPEARVSLAVTVHPKTRNLIDRDNCVASLKSYIDGLADALGVDDQTFDTPIITFGEPVRGGLLTVTLTYQPFHRSE
jgi:crossover junction endodeoxyribonuclease RusA